MRKTFNLKEHNVLVPGLAMDSEGSNNCVPVNAKASEFEAVPGAGYARVEEELSFIGKQ